VAPARPVVAAEPLARPPAQGAKLSGKALWLAGIGMLVLAGGGAFWALSRRAPLPPIADRIPAPVVDPAPPAPPAAEAMVAPVPDKTADNTPAEPSVATAAVTPSPEAIRRAIAEALRSGACSMVTGDDTSEASLRGVVGRGSEAALRATVRDAAPTFAPAWRVAAADGPYCGMLDLVRPYARSFGETGAALEIALANGRMELAADELLIPRVSMPFTGWLQLDYIAGDGTVLHMHQALGGTPYAAQSSLVFGQPKLPEFGGWAVDKPFGTDLIIGIASSVPLFRSPRPTVEKLDGYLGDLRVALAQADGAQVSATVVLVRTGPRR
jgi:eukaryotic-like serine/threonine-protein kinase